MATLGVVIQCGPDREENLRAVLASLEAQTVRPDRVVVVFDGWASAPISPPRDDVTKIVAPKFVPGETEQLRNFGARSLDTDIVHFVDSDVMLHPRAVEAVLETWTPGHIVICPYDWLGPGAREPDLELRNDPRWPRFEEPDRDWVGDASAGLSCFGGNLAWDCKEFIAIGGFWNEIHRGEDGELGLRAAELGIPMRYCPSARGWHLWHPVDLDRIYRENARNVPMIDARHWRILGGEHFELTDVDGASLAQTCPRCHKQVPTNEYWGHTCSSG